MTFKNYVSITLYHGTSQASGKELIAHGWKPYSGNQTGNLGRTKFLYCSTGKEDARWFAHEQGENTIIKISNVPIAAIEPDPEDEAGYTKEQLLKRKEMPSKFVLVKPLNKEHFNIVK